MNNTCFSGEDRVWLLLARKLSGEAETAELKELEQLCCQDPAVASIVELLGVWWKTAEAADDVPLQTRLERLQQLTGLKNKLVDNGIKKR